VSGWLGRLLRREPRRAAGTGLGPVLGPPDPDPGGEPAHRGLRPGVPRPERPRAGGLRPPRRQLRLLPRRAGGGERARRRGPDRPRGGGARRGLARREEPPQPPLAAGVRRLRRPLGRSVPPLRHRRHRLRVPGDAARGPIRPRLPRGHARRRRGVVGAPLPFGADRRPRGRPRRRGPARGRAAGARPRGDRRRGPPGVEPAAVPHGAVRVPARRRGPGGPRVPRPACGAARLGAGGPAPRSGPGPHAAAEVVRSAEALRVDPHAARALLAELRTTADRVARTFPASGGAPAARSPLGPSGVRDAATGAHRTAPRPRCGVAPQPVW
jgi:hypothetical protein